MIARRGRALGPGRLYREKRGRGPAMWVLDYKASNGERHRQALGTDRVVAERRRNEILRLRDLEDAGLMPVEGQNRPLTELVPPYLADLELRATRSHFRMAKARIESLLRQVRAPRVRDLTSQVVMRYRSQRVARGASHATVNHEVRNVKSMLNWAVACGLIAQNPIASMKHLPVSGRHQRRRRRALSDREIDVFLAAAAEDDQRMQARVSAAATIARGTKGRAWCTERRGTRVPQAPLWKAFLDTAARFVELTSTTWADLDVARRTLVLRAETTKAGKTRTIPVRQELVNELVALKVVHGRQLGRSVNANEPIFRTPDGEAWGRLSRNALRIFHRVLEHAGIARTDADGCALDIHCLRHTAASRFARAGVPLVQAQRLLGHADPALTSRLYTHLDVEDLRGAVESVGAKQNTTAPDAAQSA